MYYYGTTCDKPLVFLSHSKTPSLSFLSLPPEIRLQIYNYLLRLPDYPYPKYKPSSTVPLHPSLLQTNRQIYDEALPLLYSLNTFLAHPTLLASFPRLRSWYGPVKEASILPLIRRFYIQVWLDCDYSYGKEDVTKAFSGVEELSIDVMQTTWLGAGYRNLRVFEGVRGVGKVVIKGSTAGFEEYVAWLKDAMKSGEEDHVLEFKQDENHWARFLTTDNYN